MLLGLHFRHRSQRLRAHWSAPFKMSRASSWAWGKCRDNSAEPLFPSPSGTLLAITSTSATTGKAFSAHFPCHTRAAFLNWISRVRRGHLCGPPGTWSHSCWRHLVGEFWFCGRVHVLSLHGLWCRELISSPWKALVESFHFGGSLFPGNHLQGKWVWGSRQ